MTTLVIIAVVVALVVFARLFYYPHFLDGKKMDSLPQREYIGVQLPAGYEKSEEAMRAAWLDLIRLHQGTELEWNYRFEGTETGTKMRVIIGDDPRLMERTRQILAQKHAGATTYFVLDEHPWEELHAQLQKPTAPPEGEGEAS